MRFDHVADAIRFAERLPTELPLGAYLEVNEKRYIVVEFVANITLILVLLHVAASLWRASRIAKI